MSIVDLPRVPRPSAQPTQRPSFVSTQVTAARRYFLDLAAKRSRGITVVCGGCERVRPDYVVQRDTFSFLAIEFVAEGEGELLLAGHRYRLGPGVAFAYGPGAAHTIRNEGSRPMLKYYIDFVGAAAEAALARSTLHGWKAVQVSPVSEVIELLELLQREGGSESSFGPLMCAALIPALITKISERTVQAGAMEPRALATYQRVKHWIERHFMAVRTAEEVAQACHLDVAYLCRLFRRFGHTSPYQFLMRQKMGRAVDLLLDQELLVKEAAADLGFPDAFQFSRAFKRTYGLAPERFIQQERGRPKR